MLDNGVRANLSAAVHARLGHGRPFSTECTTRCVPLVLHSDGLATLYACCVGSACAPPPRTLDHGRAFGERMARPHAFRCAPLTLSCRVCTPSTAERWLSPCMHCLRHCDGYSGTHDGVFTPGRFQTRTPWLAVTTTVHAWGSPPPLCTRDGYDFCA